MSFLLPRNILEVSSKEEQNQAKTNRPSFNCFFLQDFASNFSLRVWGVVWKAGSPSLLHPSFLNLLKFASGLYPPWKNFHSDVRLLPIIQVQTPILSTFWFLPDLCNIKYTLLSKTFFFSLSFFGFWKSNVSVQAFLSVVNFHRNKAH